MFLTLDMNQRSSIFCNDEDELLCYECNNNFNHIVETRTILPDQLKDDESYKSCYSFIPTQNRGSTVYTIFHCEEGHYWYIAMGFHKGITEVNTNSIENGDDIFKKTIELRST